MVSEQLRPIFKKINNKDISNICITFTLFFISILLFMDLYTIIKYGHDSLYLSIEITIGIIAILQFPIAFQFYRFGYTIAKYSEEKTMQIKYNPIFGIYFLIIMILGSIAFIFIFLGPLGEIADAQEKAHALGTEFVSPISYSYLQTLYLFDLLFMTTLISNYIIFRTGWKKHLMDIKVKPNCSHSDVTPIDIQNDMVLFTCDRCESQLKMSIRLYKKSYCDKCFERFRATLN